MALFILTNISNKIVEKFPVVDCETLEGYQNDAYMEQEAIYEYESN